MAATSDWETFFKNSRKPEHYDEIFNKITKFIAKHYAEKKKIVLVTSGGTTVPLESRTVRFIDNFSVGTRGSSSAEYFLAADYAVIFLHRRGSLRPYERHLQHRNLLDMLEIQDQQVTVCSKHKNQLSSVLQRYQDVRSADLLLTIDFTSLSEYLYHLRGLSQALSGCGSLAMLYLAAAVSDFYIPMQDMLETNPELLVPKAKQALQKYNHQVVVANVLERRKFEVAVVTETSEDWIRLTDDEKDAGTEIETRIIQRLSRMHDDFINS